MKIKEARIDITVVTDKGPLVAQLTIDGLMLQLANGGIANRLAVEAAPAFLNIEAEIKAVTAGVPR